MTQTALPFDLHTALPARRATAAGAAAVTADGGLDATGFAIGWDHARYHCTPPLAHLHADNPVRQGWSAGRAAFGARTWRATPAVRRWLQLRLQAWTQGQAFEDVQVTPHFLAQLETDRCPVTREPLGAAGDAAEAEAAGGVVCRLNPAAAYAAGNLAWLGPRARQALQGRDAEAVLAALQRVEAEGLAELDGLNAAEWARLAALVSCATPLPHARAATLPLRLLPPNRVRVLNPVQALQVMLTLQFTEAGYARRLVALAALMPCSETRLAFQVFMHTLLARRLEAERLNDRMALRQAMEDSWADALVQRRWQRLALRLDAAACEQLLQRAARRGLNLQASRWVGGEQATEGWALDCGGRAATEAAPRRPQAAAAH